MRVVISIAEHEQELAVRWLDWIVELGGTDGHSLWIIPSANVKMSNLSSKAQKAFGGRVSIIKDEEQETSDWQVTEAMRSAAGPNSSFRQVAWDAYMNKRGPYFWCELDCIPLRKDWLDRLEAEYKSCGKPFMGANVQIESVPEHLSGNAIYPTNIPEVAPTLVKRTEWIPKGQDRAYELAFDIAGAREVLPQSHFTNLIQHKFRFKGFESRYEFDAVIDKNAVVFHSDKKGTIFKYLRENLSVGLSTDNQPRRFDGATSVTPDCAKSVPDSSASGSLLERGDDAQNFRDGLPWKSTIETSCPANPIQSDPYPPTIGVIKELVPAKTWHGADVVNTEGSATVVSQVFVSEELKDLIAKQSVIRNGLPAMSPPWENREDTERDVKMLCDTLALFAKAPIYKSRVRQALREAKIIK